MRVGHIQFFIDQGKSLHHVFTLGDDLPPVFSRRLREVDGNNPIIRSIEACPHVELIFEKLGIKSGLCVIDNSFDRPAILDILEIHFCPRPPMADGVDQVLSIVDHINTDKLVRPNALSEDLFIFADVRAQGMIIKASSCLTRAAHVVESLVILVEKDFIIQRIRKFVWQIVPGLNIQDSELNLILPSISDGVNHQFSLRRDGPDADLCCLISTHRMRINQHFVLAGRINRRFFVIDRNRPLVDHGEILTHTPHGKELMVAPPGRRTDIICIHELAKAFFEVGSKV